MASRFVTGYVITDVAETYLDFARAIQAAQRYNASARRSRRRMPGVAIQAEIEAAFLQFQRGMERAATVGASTAQEAMRRHLQITAVRPETNAKPHLKSLLTARPFAPQGIGGFATGSVGVGEIKTLDRAIDPDYPEAGPYWRAQEQGTNKLVGRRIFGYFFGAGQIAEVPRAQYRGQPGPHAEFAATRGKNSTFLGVRGGQGGPGRISVPLKPRGFIRDGAAEGRVAWAAEVQSAEVAAITRLARIRP